MKRTPGISTTDLVGRMLLCTKTHFIQSLTQLLSGEGGPGDETERKARANDMSRTLKDYASDWTGHHVGLSIFGWGENQMTSFIRGHWEPQPWQRVIYVDGGFDFFSAGHLNFLQTIIEEDMPRFRRTSSEHSAKEDASPGFNRNSAFIVVGIHSDAVVNKHKGLNYPIMNIYERMLCVLPCGYVSSAIFDAPFSPSQEFLESLPFGRVDAVYHGATSFMPSEQDPYIDAKKMGIFKKTAPHGAEDMTAELIMSRIIGQRDTFEARQRQKAKKAEMEQIERHRQAEQDV